MFTTAPDRLIETYTTDGGAVDNGGTTVLTYAAASSVAGDIVINQTAYGYDGDGNNTETVHAQRNNTDPVLGTSAEGAVYRGAKCRWQFDRYARQWSGCEFGGADLLHGHLL